MLNSKVIGQIHIVGPLKLQNRLLRDFLEESVGLTCVCWEDSERLLPDTLTHPCSLILWDCIDTAPVDLWAELDTEFNSKGSLALFNVSPDLGIYAGAVNRGVRGIFLEGESPSKFTKGIPAILNGELWFPRDILSRCLSGPRNSSGLPHETRPGLTPREKEILSMIASGGSNGKIADDLCISPNTVKTHIYNIYQKINVPNRLKASLWATRNLYPNNN